MANESNSRTPRSSESREDEMRDMSWEPPRLLPSPKPKKGTDFQYVRKASRGMEDNINFSQALRNKWEPVKASDYPELGKVISDTGTGNGHVVFGGMILCERPSYIGEELQKRADAEVRAQVEALDKSYLSDNSSAVPKFAEHKRTAFGDD